MKKKNYNQIYQNLIQLIYLIKLLKSFKNLNIN